MPNEKNVSANLTPVLTESQANNSLLNKGISLENVSAGHIRKTSSSAAYETVLQVGGSGFVSGRLVTGALSGATAEMRLFDNSVADANKIGHGFAGANSAVCASCDNANFGDGLIVQLKSDGSNPVEGLITIIPNKPGASSTLVRTAVAELSAFNPNLNSPNPPFLTLFNGTGDRRKGLIEFDLSAEPFGREVASGTLRIFAQSGITSSNIVDVYGVLLDWDVNQVTHNDRLTSTPWNTPGLGSGTDRQATAAGSIAPNAPDGDTPIDIDITGLVQQWINQEIDNNGIVIQWRDVHGQQFFIENFFAIEPTHVPQLLITYN